MGKFTEIEKVLNKYGETTVKALVDGLNKQKKITTGELESSIHFNVRYFGNVVNFKLFLKDYYKWVDQGRKPGSWPPEKEIRKWIADKASRGQGFQSVFSQTGRGKNKAAPKVGTATSLSKMKTAVFFVRRKIFKKGIKPTKFYRNVVNKTSLSALQKDLRKALKSDFLFEVRQIKKEYKGT